MTATANIDKQALESVAADFIRRVSDLSSFTRHRDECGLRWGAQKCTCGLHETVDALVCLMKTAAQELQPAQPGQINEDANEGLTDAPSRTRTLNPLIKSQQPDGADGTSLRPVIAESTPARDGGESSARDALGDARDLRPSEPTDDTPREAGG